jgi:hypothetical protein
LEAEAVTHVWGMLYAGWVALTVFAFVSFRLWRASRIQPE